MSRRLSQQFACQPLAELTHQLLLAPSPKRVEQVRRAERLHDEIDVDRNYPLHFVTFRITGYRSESDDATLVGAALRADLRLLIDMLSRSVGMPRSAHEPLLSPAELAVELSVSTKTVGRWRRAGLRWRWVAPAAGGRPVLVFTRSAVDRFLSEQPRRVARAARFSKLSARQRADLLDGARALAIEPGMTPFRAARRLAGTSGRAIETIRQLLEQHDREAAADPIFDRPNRPLDSRAKRVIERAARRGIPAGRIAARFHRAPSTIHRIVRARRGERLRRLRIAYIASPTFDRDDAEQVLLGPEPAGGAGPRPPGLDAALAALPAPLRHLYDRPCLASRTLRHLLVRMNFLKYRAAARRDALDRYQPAVAMMDRIEADLRAADAIRLRLVQASLPLVLTVAHQHLIDAQADRAVRLVDLLESGTARLITLVDAFDSGRGRPFGTQLTWALRRCYARQQPSPDLARPRSDEAALRARLLAAARAGGIDLAADG